MGRALPGPDDYEQIPALAERGRARTARFFEMLDPSLAPGAHACPAEETNSFAGGDRRFESAFLQR